MQPSCCRKDAGSYECTSCNVEYDKLVEMEDINAEFSTCDVVIVLGANDVVNPAAKEDPSSPIYMLPILNVEDAKTTIVNKYECRLCRNR